MSTLIEVGAHLSLQGADDVAAQITRLASTAAAAPEIGPQPERAALLTADQIVAKLRERREAQERLTASMRATDRAARELDAVMNRPRPAGRDASLWKQGLDDQSRMAVELSAHMKALAASEATAAAQTAHLAAQAPRVAMGGRHMAGGLLQVAQAMDDVQYGVRGVLNNIPGVVMSLGGGMGLAGGLSIAALAAYALYANWDRLMNAFGMGQTESQKRLLADLKRIADETAQTFRKFADDVAFADQALSQDTAAQRFAAGMDQLRGAIDAVKQGYSAAAAEYNRLAEAVGDTRFSQGLAAISGTTDRAVAAIRRVRAELQQYLQLVEKSVESTPRLFNDTVAKIDRDVRKDDVLKSEAEILAGREQIDEESARRLLADRQRYADAATAIKEKEQEELRQLEEQTQERIKARQKQYEIEKTLDPRRADAALQRGREDRVRFEREAAETAAKIRAEAAAKIAKLQGDADREYQDGLSEAQRKAADERLRYAQQVAGQTARANLDGLARELAEIRSEVDRARREANEKLKDDPILLQATLVKLDEREQVQVAAARRRAQKEEAERIEELAKLRSEVGEREADLTQAITPEAQLRVAAEIVRLYRQQAELLERQAEAGDQVAAGQAAAARASAEQADRRLTDVQREKTLQDLARLGMSERQRQVYDLARQNQEYLQQLVEAGVAESDRRDILARIADLQADELNTRNRISASRTQDLADALLGVQAQQVSLFRGGQVSGRDVLNGLNVTVTDPTGDVRHRELVGLLKRIADKKGGLA